MLFMHAVVELIICMYKELIVARAWGFINELCLVVIIIALKTVLMSLPIQERARPAC
jgi:hypothetical protein